MMPRRIPEPDRTWFAVAAYNVGLRSPRGRARSWRSRQGRNPDRWEDVREFLPLLSQERWYTRTQARLRARLGAGALRRQRAGLPEHPRRSPGIGARARRTAADPTRELRRRHRRRGPARAR